MASEALHVLRAAQVREPPAGESRWLVQPLWSTGAVGIIGGAPKSCKTWLALELAVAVASGKPCLGRFPVPTAGPALVFAAEDGVCQRSCRFNLSQGHGASGEPFSGGCLNNPDNVAEFSPGVGLWAHQGLSCRRSVRRCPQSRFFLQRRG